MLEILKRIQTDVADIKGRVERFEGSVERLDGNFQRLEGMAKKQRRDSAAMLVMIRGTAGVFDERMSELELDIQLIKDRRE